MAMAICPFCTSGVPWNACACRWALVAQRSNLIEARKAFLAAGGKVSVSARDFQPATAILMPRLRKNADGGKVVAGLCDAVAFARGDPTKARVTVVETIAPPGECAYCDRRRHANAAAASRRRAKEKAQPPGDPR